VCTGHHALKGSELARTVPDQDQGIDALERDGVDVDEVDREDAASLHGEELALVRQSQFVI
jgi:hypothetical protein